MCGGRLVITPCSRVGHVFRKTTPYSFPGGTSHIVDKNNGRLAAVWLDEWRSFYFAMFPGPICGNFIPINVQFISVPRDFFCTYYHQNFARYYVHLPM